MNTFELLDGKHVVATFTHEEDANTAKTLWVAAFGNEHMTVKRVEADLLALALTLDNARHVANSIEATAPQNDAYGHIEEALKATLSHIVGWTRADAAYEFLVHDGEDVTRAISRAMEEVSSVQVLAQFDDYALAAMCSGGKWDDSNGRLLTATVEEVNAVFAWRKQREEHWEATEAADSITTPVSSVESDTVVPARFNLEVNGTIAEDAYYLDRWHVIYMTARAMQSAGYDLEEHAEFLTAVNSARQDEHDMSVVCGDLETSTLSVRVIPAND